MAEQFTPLPETDVIDGQPVDIGYNPADSAELERSRLVYERQAMAAIAQQPLVDAARGAVNPYEQAMYDTDPSFFKMLTSSEFWKRDVAPRIGNAIKGIGANTAGAPVDATVLAAHTIKWLWEKRNETNSYGFLKDMPDFEQIPMSGDWIGSNILNANIEAPEFMVSGFLSPDPKDVAVASKILTGVAAEYVQEATIGSTIGFARDVARTKDPLKAQAKIDNYALFRDAHNRAEKFDEPLTAAEQEELYLETGWWREPADGKDRFWIPDDKINWTAPEWIEQFIVPENMVTLSKGQQAFRIPLREIIGDGSELFQLYPSLRRLNIDIAIDEANPKDVQAGVQLFTAPDGTKYRIIDPKEKGAKASVLRGPKVSDYEFTVHRSDSMKELQSSVLHEVNHVVQGIEGLSRGGSPAEFEGMLESLNDIRKQVIVERIHSAMTEAGEAIYNSHGDMNYKLIEEFKNNDPVIKELLDKIAESGESVSDSSIRIGLTAMEDVDIKGVYQEQLDNFRIYLEAAEGGGLSVDETTEWLINNTALPYTPTSLYYSLLGEIESRFVQEVFETLGEEVVANTLPTRLMKATVSDMPAGTPIVKEQAPVEQASRVTASQTESIPYLPEGTHNAGRLENIESDLYSGLTPEDLELLRKDKRLKDIAYAYKANFKSNDQRVIDRIIKGQAAETQLLDDLEGGLGISREEAQEYVHNVINEMELAKEAGGTSATAVGALAAGGGAALAMSSEEAEAASSTGISTELLESIRKHEGEELEAYQDSEGIWTIGYGTNLEARGYDSTTAQGLRITKQQAEQWLMESVKEAKRAATNFPEYQLLNDVRKDVLIEMVYNLGPSGTAGFKKMFTAIRAGDWKEAAAQMLNSKWASQVGQRARTLAKQMETGTR